MLWEVLTGRSTVSGIDLAWFSSLSSERPCIFMVLYLCISLNFLLHYLLHLLVSWDWWDWPLMWLTNHCPSVLWRCWLGHPTRKVFSEMTCNVSSGRLNPSIAYTRGGTRASSRHRQSGSQWCCRQWKSLVTAFTDIAVLRAGKYQQIMATDNACLGQLVVKCAPITGDNTVQYKNL